MMKKNLWALALCVGVAFSASAATVSHITASDATPSKGHLIKHIADGKAATRWAIPRAGWVKFEFTKKAELHNFYILPFKPTQRQLKFQIVYSDDNQTWKPLTSEQKKTDLGVKKGEIFTFSSIHAKYVRFHVYGTNANKWSAINELQFNSKKAVKKVSL